MLKSSLVYFFCVLLLYTAAKAQSTRTIRQEMDVISVYNKAHTPEKIFIQTDKQNYSKKDTLWFKAYVFDVATLGAATKSGLMYIDIADETNRVINRNMVLLTAGVGWGNIPLIDSRFPEGTYTLRAYTNWMRNFDEHYIFSRQFIIEGPLDEDWMINSRFELTEKEGLSNVETDLTFVTNEGRRMFAEELKAKITAGRRTLYRTTLRTGVDGTLAFDFNLPDKASTQQLNITLTKKRTKQAGEVTFNVPVIVNRDEKVDLQFMPEGGTMISGMLNKVAFKAINEEGKGVYVEGEVYNSVNQKVADFKAAHKGMGVFELKTEPGQVYKGRINYHSKALTFPLPQVSNSGLMLKIDNQSVKDSVIVTVVPSADAQLAKGVYYLLGQARNVVCYGAVFNSGKGYSRFTVPRSAFPTGVARFTLLSQVRQPVAERIVFINHHDHIKLNITTSKSIYGFRDSMNLNIVATDKDEAPVQGSFSLAVTDDAQVKLDSNFLDLPAKMLLADDLKGDIENPGWYFSKGDSITKAAALDVLLLTQGWVNYDWAEVFAPKQKQLSYKAEPEFAVKGRVINAFGKPVEKSNIILLSTMPLFVADATTNANGEFRFTEPDHYDTVAYNLQASNKRGRMFNVGVEVDEFVPPVFTDGRRRLIPLNVNVDTSRLNAIRTRQLYIDEEARITGTRLKEVQIKAKKAVKGSKALFSTDEIDFIMNDEDMKAQGKKTLLDVLRKNVPNFQDFPQYRINFLPAAFRIDGLDPGFYKSVGLSVNQYITQILTYIDAEDVRGIEIMTGAGGSSVEITTYSGNGLFMKKMPGTYLYRPPVFASRKEFYSPRYTVKKPVLAPDNRSTIFWEPNIITGTDGKASVSFYSADKSANYTINLQGADMEGLVGAEQSKVSVVRQE